MKKKPRSPEATEMLRRISEIYGGRAQIARALSVDPALVTRWGYIGVPADIAERFCETARGIIASAVTPAEGKTSPSKKRAVLPPAEGADDFTRWYMEQKNRLGLTHADIAERLGVRRRAPEIWVARHRLHVPRKYRAALRRVIAELAPRQELLGFVQSASPAELLEMLRAIPEIKERAETQEEH